MSEGRLGPFHLVYLVREQRAYLKKHGGAGQSLLLAGVRRAGLVGLWGGQASWLS